MEVEHYKHDRWENGGEADSPVREVRLKALILKEQATCDQKTAKHLDTKASCQFGTSLNARMSFCFETKDSSPPQATVSHRFKSASAA
jgi:hypothetical protein